MKFFYSRTSRFLFLCFAVLAIASCNNADKNASAEASFGKKIDDKGAIPISEIEKNMKTGEKSTMKVEGKIEAVCQAKGCWMDLRKDDKTVVRVTFKDYEFFVPKDCSGKTAIVEGVASYDTTTVEMQKHYAEDAGKSAEEIASIKDPKVELVFEAEGVIIR